MNPATNTTIIAPTIKYVLLEPADPLLRLLLLFTKIFLFLVCGEILAHAARFSESKPARPRVLVSLPHSAVSRFGKGSGGSGVRVMVAHVVDLEGGVGDAV